MKARVSSVLRVLLGASLSISAASSLARSASAAPVRPTPPESWIGDLRIGESVTTLQLQVDGGNPAASRLSVLPQGPSDLPAASASAEGAGAKRKLTLTFELAGGTMALDIPGAAVEASGSLPGGGRYTLRRLAAPPEPASILGYYRCQERFEASRAERATIADPRRLIVARFAEFGPWLFLTDLESGEIGPLLPIGSGRFLWGATLASPALPARAVVEIDPRVGTLRLDRGGRGGARRYRRERFVRTDVRFDSGAIALAGTVTQRAGRAPRSGLPGIVLLHGSGPEDRHYLEIWTQLFAAQGLAVLAYDKRGTGASQGDWQEAGLEELAADAIAAVRCLRAQPGVDPARIGVFGISQGGWVAPQVAAALPDLAFVVVHAGAAGTPAEQGRDFLAAEMRAYGLGDDEIAKADALQRLSDEVTRGHRPWSDYKAAYDQAVAEKAVWILGPADAEGSPFRRLFRHLLDFDPLPYWNRVRCPVLALYGDHDWIVPAAANAPKLRAAFAQAGLTRAEVQVLPGGNHVMLAADSGVHSEYPSRQRFVPGYFTTLSDWLARTLKNE